MLFEIASSNAYMTDKEKFLLSLAASRPPGGSTVVEVGAFMGEDYQLLGRRALRRPLLCCQRLLSPNSKISKLARSAPVCLQCLTSSRLPLDAGRHFA